MDDTATLPGPTVAGITVAPGAAARIREILAAEPPEKFVRLAVNAGGCSGFSYAFSVDDALGADDARFGEPGAGLVVDAASLDLLAGCVVDYTDSLAGAHFAVKNPNASSGCGCGTSFAV